MQVDDTLLADAAAGSDYVKIRSGATFTRSDIDILEAHEGWVVVDYGDVVVHLFSPDQRDYYDLEELWQDGKVLLRVQ